MSVYGRDDPRYNSLSARFWNKVSIPDDSDECWEWLASKNKHGYGEFTVNGKLVTAHRTVWRLVHGPFPNNLQVLHSCDNPSCVNPYHLFIGTNQDNIRDAFAKGRIVRPRGEKHPRSKLTLVEVLEIRRLHSPRKTTYKKLGRMFGVSEYAIRNIIQRRTWNHV